MAVVPMLPHVSPLRLRRRPRPPEAHRILAQRLREDLRGDVRFDDGARDLYSTDASNYRHRPLGVVVPRDVGDVVRTLARAREARVPLVARGGGTSLAGQTCNDGVVIDFSRYMNRIVELDADARLARVEPGVVLDALRGAAAPYELTFGPDPATHQYCTLGGMIANNSCGVRSVLAANFGPGPTTAHNLAALDVITADGTRLSVGPTDDATYARVQADGGRPAEIFRALRAFQQRHADLIRRAFPDIPRRVSGYNLPALLPEQGFHIARALAGSEATLALTLEATVHLVPALPHRVLAVIGFDDVYAAADAVPELMGHKPVGLEGFDRDLTRDLQGAGLDPTPLQLLPDGDAWLMVEFGGRSMDEAGERARACVEGFTRASRRGAAVFENHDEQEQLWTVRESGLAATARVAGRNPTWPGWEDSAVPPERLGAYLRDLRQLFDRHGYHADFYGHFGQGCVHCRVDFDLRSTPGIARFRRFLEDAADLVHRHGGSLSGEHGDGQARGELLGRMFPREVLDAFREFKAIWDPEGLMNPGRIIDARPLDADLRLGSGYDPPVSDSTFQFPEDMGSFAHAALRCVGVGKCRKTDSGTMCPSYMVTGEEQHATRGRARLLFEMLQRPPDAVADAGPVRDALDLCLACKGCKDECPVHVDMATYKAEFLSRYFARHWRPRTAHAFGHIHTWARLVAGLRAQRLVNSLMQVRATRRLAQMGAGMAPDRAVPAFAPQTFRQWFRSRPAPRAPGGDRVLLWPDTFNDHFHPETLQTAVHVLEGLGFEVAIPERVLCCGRPLYDFGLLSMARRRLTTVLDALGDDIRAGTPVVGLEPSCVSVFRDELVNLLPRDEQAHRLRGQTLTLAELLDRSPQRLSGLRVAKRAVVHGHCHHKAVMHMDADRRVLEALGVDYRLLDSGCCGMAGAFGFEHEHYDVSIAIGERVLLPAVRDAGVSTLVLADGFSCREQIAQTTSRLALHLADVVAMALDGQATESATAVATAAERPPEFGRVADHSQAGLGVRHLAGAALAMSSAFVLLRLLTRRRRAVGQADVVLR
jgi:FAD/FMN-containing dehydrogenase